MSDGDICFDIGANIGVVSVFMARAASRVSVYAFEPIRLNQCIIRLNAELNQVDIQVAGVAVADVCGTANFSESVDSAYSSLRPTGRREERRSLPVTVTTLDSYLMANSVPRIDVMKIDVEGAEELVLRGGQNVLADRTRSPRVIMIELVDANLKAFGADVGRVVRLLAKYGYRGFVRDADRRELRPFGPADHNRFYNVFFLKDESKRHHGES
jgi:FkbM family methyltransferase